MLCASGGNDRSCETRLAGVWPEAGSNGVATIVSNRSGKAHRPERPLLNSLALEVISCLIVIGSLQFDGQGPRVSLNIRELLVPDDVVTVTG